MGQGMPRIDAIRQTNVTSLVERVSRFTLILKNQNKRTQLAMGRS